jgi:hypothetical protein
MGRTWNENKLRGGIVRKMRLAVTDTNADGVKTAGRGATAGGVIVHLRDGARNRREFTRYCEANKVIAVGCEFLDDRDDTYDTHTGARLRAETLDSDGKPVRIPTAYQVMGDGPALAEAMKHPAVASWNFALSFRIPVTAGGSGTDRVPPSSGTMFGRPETIATTATAIDKARADNAQAQRKTGDL